MLHFRGAGLSHEMYFGLGLFFLSGTLLAKPLKASILSPLKISLNVFKMFCASSLLNWDHDQPVSKGSKTHEPVTKLSLVLGVFCKGERNTPMKGDGGDNLVKWLTPEFVWGVSKMRYCLICDPKQLLEAWPVFPV